MRQVKTRVDYKKLITDKKKAKCIDKMEGQIDREQKKISLNAMANKIRKEAKNKAVKNQH